MRSVLADDFQDQPYWWQAAPPEDARDAELPASVDVAVVGGGYCGLCCALELAENGRSVAVLEAGPLGHGASTRNGGMVTGGQKFVVSGAIKGVEPERAARFLEDARESLSLLEARVEKYGLDADYRRSGRIILAATPRHYRRLRHWAELLEEKAGANVALLSRQRLPDEVGGEAYHGGLLIRDYGGLHPAKYHRALRRAAAARGASLHSHAAARSIRASGNGYLVATERGTITAREVFVATNGYTDGLLPFLQRRIVPVQSYIIATEPLPAETMDSLLPNRRMLSDTRRDLAYFRPSPDGTRVIYGARPGIFETDLASAAAALHGELRRVWPVLSDARVAFCWNGFVGMSNDRIPHMGIHEGVHYAVGCNGSGVAMMSYLGYQSARKILGLQNRPCAFDQPSFPAPPFYRGHAWFLPFVAGWYRACDTLDRWRR